MIPAKFRIAFGRAFIFTASDENIACVDLKANFGWLEWTSPEMNNEHVKDYYDTYGPNTQATLWQRKTPK